jgi:hypothetical protein
MGGVMWLIPRIAGRIKATEAVEATRKMTTDTGLNSVASCCGIVNASKNQEIKNYPQMMFNNDKEQKKESSLTTTPMQLEDEPAIKFEN